MTTLAITELQGDGIGPELQASVHAIAEVLPLDFDFRGVDWSLETRERKGGVAIDQAEDSMRETRLVLKYPTVTGTRSPNALIRRRVGFSVIYRPCISIPGIKSNFNLPVNLHIVRVATGGTYDDPGQLVGKDSAVSLRLVERGPCEEAAAFAFELARKKGLHVTSSSKHTIQKVTDGLFQTIVGDVHRGYQDVLHKTELFDALLGKVLIRPQDYQVVCVLNEYGDFLSDMAAGLVGSLGTGASGNYSFNEKREIEIAMFDPAGGTAPDIAGQDICNPTAMLLSLGMLLDHIDRNDLGHALRNSLLGAIRDGECTRDLGGELGTRDFTSVVCDRLSDAMGRGDGSAAQAAEAAAREGQAD